MSKFVIECPNCGRYVQAKTGFWIFGKKKIDCACGNVIDVRTDKLTSRTCPHCGNDVVFDQSKGEKARCPVCHEAINTVADQEKLTEFHCAQCGVRLQVAKTGVDTYTCPVCDHVNDVAERLAAEKIKKEGLASVIKYEGDNSTFVWKHPIEDFNYGSQLIVHESQEAVFFRNGQALDTFGPGRYTLETQQLPLMEKLYKPLTDSTQTFHSEVYFINKTVQMAVKWGTPDRVRYLDPITGLPLEIGASGEMNLAVENGRKLLIKLVGTMKGISWEEGPGFTKSLQASFRPLIVSAVKTNLASAIKQNRIDVLEIDEHLDLLSEALSNKIRPGFEEYGLTVPQFFVTHVQLPQQRDEPTFDNLERIRVMHTAEMSKIEYRIEAEKRVEKARTETTAQTAEEESKAEIETAHRKAVMEAEQTATEQARWAAERRGIEAQAEAYAHRVQGMSEAEVMQAKGYNQKDVLQAEVQKAYAEGIGKMGAGGSAGGGGGGSGMLGDIMGLGVGMAAAQTIMPTLGNMFRGMNPNGPAASDGSAPSNGTAPEGAPAGADVHTGPASAPADTWDCPACGNKGITFKFCPECGAKKPEPKPADTWDCPNCGMKKITFKFCPECGTKKPEPRPETPEKPTWTCPDCGTADITGKFCPECGKKRGE